MSSPKISFIIPVYNTAKYLDECMASVMGQTFKDIEIILVDDGSTDGISANMCDNYANRDPRIHVIHKENGGLMSAWIAGTDQAAAPYLCYVDSDDWIDTDMADELIQMTDEAFIDSEIIASNYIVEKKGERRKETQSLTPGIYTGSSLETLRLKLLGNEIRPVTMSRCMKLISRSLVLDNIKYCNRSITLAEDVNILLPCLCDCKRLVITNGGYYYHYRAVQTSIVHGYDPKLLKKISLADKTFRSILRDKNITNADEQLDREYIYLLLLVLKSELRNPDKNSCHRVKKIFMQKNIRKKILNTKVTVSSKSNKLLYFCICHPVAPVILFTKVILHIFDVKTN